ncbi:MAG: CotH kinase family protein [Saprospiraceae bacterium]
MRFYFIISLLFSYFLSLVAQPVFPENGVVFNDKVIPKIYISIDQDSFNLLFQQENLQSNHEYPADFIWDDGTNKDTIRQVGFRLRGKSSRFSAKKSFKIKFDHFGSGTFYGLDELNINGEHNDPSIMRSKLCWDLMRFAGIEGSRSNHVALFVNGVYIGLYMNVEHVDRTYLRSRSKDPDGQLFKCFYGVDLTYLGDNPPSYSTEIYEPVNNKNNPDYNSFTAFLKVLNTPNDPNFRCKLEEKLDVDDYLKRLAIEILTGHWDNPVYNKNNAYLYYNPKTGKYQLFSYDVDNSFGIDWFNIPWHERNVYDWAKSNEARPIYDIIHKIPEYKQRLGYYIETFTRDFFNEDFIKNHVNPLINRIAPFRSNDPFAPLDYGYSFVDFLHSYENALGHHVKNGLFEYVRLRNSSAKIQIGTPNPAPIIENQSVTSYDQKVSIYVDVDHKNQVELIFYYRVNNSTWSSQILKDDGNDFDEKAGDGRYHWQFTLTGKNKVDYYFTASNLQNQFSRLPFCGEFSQEHGFNTTPRLVINEFMAENTTIPDNAGEYDDWLEIYNADDDSVFLGDKFLTDNPSRLDKWKMPEITLPPGGFILFWADEDQDQGDYHTNFKLSKNGEFLGIYDAQSNNFAPIDTFSFGSSSSNVSYGRYPDGVGPIIRLNSPTPGKSNVTSSLSKPDNLTFTIYPNPTSDFFRLEGITESCTVLVYDMTGKLKISYKVDNPQIWTCPFEKWPSGTYVIQVNVAGKISAVTLQKL